MQRMFWLPLALLTTALAWAQPPVREPVKEGPLERLVLDDGTDTEAAAWQPAEAVVTVDKKHVLKGDTALRLHIDVNWETGEKNYPVGWPRMLRTFPEPLQAWQQYEFFEFSIFAESSRSSLPAEPLGLILKGKDGKSVYTRPLTELKLGKWTDYRIAIADLPGCDPCTGIQFYISESNYKHGDKLDFWFDNMSLIRFTQPVLAETAMPEYAVVGGSRYLITTLHLLGMKPDEKMELVWELSSGKHTASTGRVNATGGKRRYYLPLPNRLAPGAYELKFKCGDQQSPPYPVMLSSSPWQEDAK
ncbi:MAG: hypothetical protein ABFD94_19655 [Armatimonadia bacterium]